ncbi:hypothetical protein BDV27DRAFT_159085 [Aspergillus caelatus]|uniref:Uncharacterized protein n=1 Tax=Aspergillus caelatus TaxID=61420 RepID=A0A5N6ZZS8_9EURO|nr:uncharacterized protein BDV27DRAFT_159085 [Aspergillus caelatus]KAE8363111.1 hypothetical protein BDV27DRAFT_159085 [Aspergillus caelatus]
MSYEFAPGPQAVRILRLRSALSSLITLLNTIISSPLLCTIEGFRWHGFLQAADCWNSSAGARSSTPLFLALYAPLHLHRPHLCIV